MHSFATSSPLRLDLGASRIGGIVLVSLAVLASVALSLTALPAPVAAVVLIGAVAACWIESRRPRPTGLRWQSDGALWLDWPDGREEPVQLIGDRHLGALSVLTFAGEAGRRRLLVWPDTLPVAQRRALRRRLRGRRSIVSDA